MLTINSIINHPLLIVIILAYILITFMMWRRDIYILGIKPFPFGFSTKFFNKFYSSISSSFSRILDNISDASYSLIGFLSLLVIPIGIIGIILYYVKIPFISDFSSVFFGYIGSTFLIAFEGWLFWLILFLSIIIHEMMHGITAAHEEIPIVGTGFLILPGILYGGYVNVDFNKFILSKGEEEEEEEKLETDEDIKSTMSEYELEIYNKIDGIESQMQQREKARKQLEKLEKTITTDKDIRGQLGHVIASGLFVNTFLVILGLMFQYVFDQGNDLPIITEIAQLVISINVLLIVFNLMPIPFSDGRKLLKLKLLDLFSESTANRINALISSLTFYGIVFLFLLLILR